MTNNSIKDFNDNESVLHIAYMISDNYTFDCNYIFGKVF